MKIEHLITEFLDEIQNRADQHFKGRREQAFVAWFIEAEYGNVQWKFTDGPSDGGIDAIVWCEDDDPSTIILQSKFTEKPGRNRLAFSAYDAFESVVKAFRYGNETFETLLDSVTEELRKLYRKASERLEISSSWHTRKKAFKLITTSLGRREREFDLIPGDGFVYFEEIVKLYAQYRNVWTPKARPLQLSVQDKLCYNDRERNTTSYLFNAQVSDFRKYLEKNDVARLVARNIRYNLGGRVGRGIRATYEKKPKDFWYLHNGLTLICDDYVEKNQTATLINPSVVNGAQTLYSIASSPLKESKALSDWRIIVRGGGEDPHFDDDGWVQSVIRGVNTQNRVKNYDFRSNEPEQVELQKRFKEERVFYERKRGEWKEVRTDPKFKGHFRVALSTLGQILTVISDDDGHGVLLAKRGTEEIFEEKNYRRLFPSRSRVGFRFKRIYFAYRIYRLLNKTRLGCKSNREFRRYRHAFWNAVWIMQKALLPAFTKLKLSVERIKLAFDDFEGYGFSGIRAKKAIRILGKSLWVAYRMGRKRNPEHWTPNNFFKQKYGNQVIQKLALPKIRIAMKFLEKHLEVQA